MSEFNRRVFAAGVLLAFVSLFGFTQTASAGFVPTFTKVFSPDTIGPGSTTELIFTISNDDPSSPVDLLAFDDEFPVSVDLAEPSFVSNSCGGTLTLDDEDDDSEYDVRLEDGTLGAGQDCTIVVNVTSATPGVHMNVTGGLTSDAGSSGTASADLTVDDDLPGFTKSFDPPVVDFGERSTLTFVIDNTLNVSPVPNLDFTDNLPDDMLVADPPEASTTCGTAFIPPTLTAVPGSSVIILDSNGTASFPAVAAGATCNVIVDVIGGRVGMLGNVTNNLLAEFVDAGKAAAVLEVESLAGVLQLAKEFTDDPVAPGGIVNLQFTVTNQSRDDSATGITFSDDLGATLEGLAPSGALPTDPCGAGSMLSFTPGIPPSAVLTLTGGTLPPEGSCTFDVALAVPTTAVPDDYLNEAGPVSGDVGGEPETGNVAGDLLFVVPFPQLTKSFAPGTVAAGETVTLEFTITNPGSLAMTDIAFVDELTDGSGGFPPDTTSGFLPFPVSIASPSLPTSACGGTLALVSVGGDRQGLELTGGSLAAAGMAGDSCTFSVMVDIPVGLPGSTYLNTTEEISATVDAASVTGPPASGTLVVASAPNLSKEFIDDPVLPSGGPVVLEFTLEYDVEEGTPDATSIAFTDNLTALTPAVPGLTATTVVSNTCTDAVVDIVTDPTLIDVSGGTLTASESCTIQVSLAVPPGSPIGVHANTTSEITATVDGVATANLAAEDNLVITPLVFTKEFADSVVVPGATTTLAFTIENLGASAAEDATGIFFSDNLDAALAGLTATSTTADTCGGTPSGTGTTFISYTGGSLGAGSTCSIEYEVTVPVAAADGDYLNVTSSLTATIDGSTVTVPPAVDLLNVDSELLAFGKEFIADGPVLPGDSLTLRFTVESLSATETLTDIAFEDDLDAALSGLVWTGATGNTCGGMATSAPSGIFSYAGGTLTPGETCTIEIEVEVPDAPLPGSVFTNVTSTITGVVTGFAISGNPAVANLEVQLVEFSKAFDGTAEPGGTAVLTFTIENLDSLDALSGLSFTDDLDAVISGMEAIVLPATPCGPGSMISGTSFLAVTGASLAAAGSAGDSCTFDVTVELPESPDSGSFTNTTSDLSQSGLPVAAPATALLTLECTATEGPYIQADGLLSVEAENFVSNNAGTSTPAFTVLEMLDGMIVSNEAAIKSANGPMTGNPATAPTAVYSVILDDGPQYVWLRYRAFTAGTNSFFFQLDDGPIQKVGLVFSNPNTWKWIRVPMPVASAAGEHTMTIYRRERLSELDKIVVSTGENYVPVGLGPVESAQAGGCGNIAPLLDPISNQTVVAGESKLIGFSASDIDAGDTLTIDFTGLPAFAVPGAPTGNVSVQVDVSPAAGPGDLGEYPITVTVEDDGSPMLSDTASFTLFVVPPDGDGPFLQTGGIASIEAENYFSNNPGTTSGAFVDLAGLDGLVVSNEAAIKSANGPWTTDPTMASSVTYDVVLDGAPQYLWLRFRAFTSGQNSFFVQLDDGPIRLVSLSFANPDDWKWLRVPGTLPVATSGEEHTLTVYRRERGSELDKIVLSSDPGFTPVGLGPDESPRGPGAP